jgi:arginase
MAGSFLVVPEWQGSGSARAMRLVDGAEAIRGDLPSASTTTVDIPLEAGDELGTGVHRASSLRVVHQRVLTALEDKASPVVTIGGDCGVSLGPIGRANEQATGGLAVVWFDAHPDLNTPATSPSGIFNGMVLRALTGEGVEGLVPAAPIAATSIILAGAREFDAGESEFIEQNSIAVITPDELADGTALLAAIAATGAATVYLHIDVDVLDPGEIDGLGYAVPFGLAAATLTDRIRDVGAAFPIAGASITEFAPASAEAAIDDLPVLLRIIAAITAPSDHKSAAS